MSREHLRTPEEDLLRELARVTRLFEQALPNPGSRAQFDAWMNEAGRKGLNWVQALEYVVERRSSHSELP